MTDEAWKALGIIVPSLAVVIGRYLSSREHRKTTKTVNDIYVVVNGGLQKKLDEAHQRGRQEMEQELKNK